MASKSERGAKGEQKERAALPFEPGRDRKKAKATSSSATSSSATVKSSEKAHASKASESDKSDGISARAQARVDDIRASNRKKADAKAKGSSQSGAAKASRRDSDGRGEIPAAVSKRMLRRMAVLSLTPIAVGVGIFFLSYYLLSQEILEFAPVVVLLTTMGCFGLGVVGLSYGLLSASWDEEPGDLIGMDEFKLNLGRMKDAWKESRQSKT